MSEFRALTGVELGRGAAMPVLFSGTFEGIDPNALTFGRCRRPRKIKARKSHNRKHHKPRK